MLLSPVRPALRNPLAEHRPIDSSAPVCLIALLEDTMVYDRDGQRTLKIQLLRLGAAVTLGLAIPLAITIWAYVN